MTKFLLRAWRKKGRSGRFVFALSAAVVLLAFVLGRDFFFGPKLPKVPSKPRIPAQGQRPVEPDFPTTCIGKASASRQAIFLHGIMPKGAIPPELDYTERLERIAAATGYRIAMPLSRQQCNDRQEKYCWTGDDLGSILATYGRILRSSAKCLHLDSPFGLIGFSNGGYHAARVAMRCLSPQPQWVLALGSAGDPAHAEGRSLAQCPPTTFMIGTADITLPAAKQLASSLENLQLPVRFATFEGGHDLPDAALIRFLRAQRP